MTEARDLFEELSEYSLTSLCDIAEYLYGGNTSFSSFSAAQDYFRNKIN